MGVMSANGEALCARWRMPVSASACVYEHLATPKVLRGAEKRQLPWGNGETQRSWEEPQLEPQLWVNVQI